MNHEPWLPILLLVIINQYSEKTEVNIQNF